MGDSDLVELSKYMLLGMNWMPLERNWDLVKNVPQVINVRHIKPYHSSA